ncbi:MAG: hypothetical protein KJO07_24700, partial [Deltaproteobacteria bacterium]|nr:hypothetical protein [Deltaproteobacteria bacterium]
GIVTYWRPDGTLVNHCQFEHGSPHGWYKRYHQSGEVSRQGTFAHGKLHGTDKYFRSEQKTTENFPGGLSERVWSAEMDMRHGAIVGARAYDKNGVQCSESGEPFPDRPDGVPEDASYSSTGGRWLAGSTDDEYQRQGLWRFWDSDGQLQQEVEYDGGAETWNNYYESQDEADVVVALREGRDSDARGHAEAMWAGATDADAKVLAGNLLLRTLDPADPKRRQIAEEVASRTDAPAMHWGVFMASGKKRFLALGHCLATLAELQRAGGQFDQALATIDRAIAHDHHYGTAELQVARYRILEDLGRHDEAFQAARSALALDHEAPGLHDLAASAEFKSWLESISADKMTAEGAREVLGNRGQNLTAIAAPIVLDESRDDEDDDDDDDEEDEDEEDDLDRSLTALDEAWPIAEVLGNELAPELRSWAESKLSDRIQDTYRGVYHGASESSLSGAVEAEDGTWIARLQSIFLPASMVLTEDEQYWLARWTPTPDGNSPVYYQHQDEPEWYRSSASLAGFLARRILEDTQYEELSLPAVVRERWSRAAELEREAEDSEAPKHLDIDALEARTVWIVEHLLGIELGDGLELAPTIGDWEQERELCADWPHLQAYWLYHHLVFDNREELTGLVERAELRYPAVAELGGVAKAVLAGKDSDSGLVDATRDLGLRAKALDTGHPGLLSEASHARTRQALKARDAADKAMREAKDALVAGGDDSVSDVFEMWELLESAAGDIGPFEEALCRQAFQDQDDSMTYFMRQRTGHVSILGRVMMAFGDKVDGKWKDFFEAAMKRGAEMSEEHASAIPGALYGYTLAAGDFAEAMDTVRALPLYPDHFGRRRRLEMTLAAEKLYDQPAAQEFLVQEAERFAPQFSDWQTDTVVANIYILIDKGHPKGADIFNA